LPPPPPLLPPQTHDESIVAAAAAPPLSTSAPPALPTTTLLLSASEPVQRRPAPELFATSVPVTASKLEEDVSELLQYAQMPSPARLIEMPTALFTKTEDDTETKPAPFHCPYRSVQSPVTKCAPPRPALPVETTRTRAQLVHTTPPPPLPEKFESWILLMTNGLRQPSE
jgi:hypothetical protein